MENLLAEIASYVSRGSKLLGLGLEFIEREAKLGFPFRAYVSKILLSSTLRGKY